MRTLNLYNKKEIKIDNKKLLEVDLDDLESFGMSYHGKEFLKIPEMKVDGKSITEWFTFEDFSMWWFASPTIHPKFKEGMLFIDRLTTVLEENHFNELKLEGCFDKFELIKQICKKKNIKLNISRQKFFIFLTKEKIKNSIKFFYYKHVNRNKIKKRLHIFYKYNKYVQPPPGYVLITSPDHYRRESFNPDLNKTVQKEFFIQPFLDFCSKNKIPSLCIDSNYTLKGSADILQERLQTKNIWLPLEYFFNYSNTSINKKLFKSLKKSIKQLRKKNLSKIFSYDDISLSTIIKPVMQDLFLEPYFPTHLNLLINVEKFLKETKPSVIIQTYEAGPYAKMIELAASKLNIKTIAIQHGGINSDTPDYFFNQTRTLLNPLGNIIPDLTLVFGEYFKNMLIEKSAYEESAIEVLGNPEYFDIEKIKAKLNKSKLRTKFNLPNKKIILVSLTWRFSLIKNSPDRVLLQLLYENFKNNDELIFLIRPHPGDNLDEFLLQKNYPSKNFLLSKGSLVENFVLSDVIVVIPVSTVSIEAIMFDRPIIFPDIIKKNKSKIDPVFQLLIENNLAVLADKPTFIQMINSLILDKPINSNPLQKEKIVKYLLNLNSDPKIYNYISKSE